MRSNFASIRTLVLPAGATSGARIVIDGVNGVITGYDQFNNQSFQLGPNNFEIDEHSQLVMIGALYEFVADGSVFQAFGNAVGVNGQWELSVGTSANGPHLGLVDLNTGKSVHLELVPVTGELVTDQVIRAGTTFPAVAETWHNATLSNGWANIAGLDVLAVRKQPDDFVLFQGIIGSGTVTDGTIVGTIPVGYRPSKAKAFGVAAGGTANPRIRVNTDGTLQIFGSVTAGQSISFEGCGYALT